MRAGGVVGVILAGGLGRRMGGVEKALVPLAGHPLAAWVAATLGPQVATLALNANGPADAYAALGLPILPDPVPDRPGPLAGVLAALDWAAMRGARAVVTVPCDTPFLPHLLVMALRMAEHGHGTPTVMAATGVPGQPVGLHPTVALWRTDTRPALAAALAAGERRVRVVMERIGTAAIAFPPADPDPFANLNTPEDLRRAERHIGRGTHPSLPPGRVLETRAAGCTVTLRGGPAG